MRSKASGSRKVPTFQHSQQTKISWNRIKQRERQLRQISGVSEWEANGKLKIAKKWEKPKNVKCEKSKDNEWTETGEKQTKRFIKYVKHVFLKNFIVFTFLYNFFFFAGFFVSIIDAIVSLLLSFSSKFGKYCHNIQYSRWFWYKVICRSVGNV